MKYLSIIMLVALFACKTQEGSQKLTEEQQVVQNFLDSFHQGFLVVNYDYAEAQWQSNTKIIEGDSTNAVNERNAADKYAKFVGSSALIGRVRQFLDEKNDLTELQAKQLEKILYNAANYAETAKQAVEDRVKAETEQTARLYGFKYMVDGKEVTTNDIDRMLKSETDVNKRMKVWNASKEVGKTLKSGLVKLRDLRNQVVKSLGYNDYFSYQVSDYGMTADEMMQLCNQINRELYPLYRELHTYARYELAKKYNAQVPDFLPAHWLPNRWGQDWSTMVEVQGINLDSVLKTKSAEWIVKEGEAFYKSLGFSALPESFYTKSSLYPLPAGTTYKKNNHASAWHMDLQNDLRSLMSVEPNSEWFETVHHELGHIYYYVSYTTGNVPPVLREGANRAFHEAVGSMIGMAAMQKPFLQAKGLLPANAQSDDTQKLLQEALNFVVFIPFSTGTMTGFEHDLYKNNLPPSQFNKRWWELAKKYQGIVPPTERGEEYTDAATKTHINDDAAQYYDYALSYVILFQLHDYIAKNILKQDPRATNYYGNKEVGDFLKKLLSPGATGDWRKTLKETVGSDLSAKAMVDYFSPVMDYLKKVNAGRTYTLPATMQ
ncbi:MAG: peptidase [Chitinophagaceae bacterium]|nr:peptidase [Chitinophagaceae bacterium]